MNCSRILAFAKPISGFDDLEYKARLIVRSMDRVKLTGMDLPNLLERAELRAGDWICIRI